MFLEMSFEGHSGDRQSHIVTDRPQFLISLPLQLCTYLSL